MMSHTIKVMALAARMYGKSRPQYAMSIENVGGMNLAIAAKNSANAAAIVTMMIITFSN